MRVPDSFFDNLQAATSNIDDIVFNRFATISEINNDGTVNCREDDGLTHENVLTLSHNLQVGDKVVIGFEDNSIYNPIILGVMGEETYTKAEIDKIVDGIVSGDISLDGVDVSVDMKFTGISGRDDSIILSAELIKPEE